MMTWENAINIKLNLGDISRKIISDHTGILYSHDFQAFLIANNISFKHADKLTELVSISGDDDIKIIITSIKDIPAFLSRNHDTKKFSLADLPLNAEVKTLENLSLETLVEILNYLNTTNLLQPINQSTITHLIAGAQTHASAVRITVLQKDLESLLLSEIHYNTILQIGSCFGKLQFELYKSATQSGNEMLKSFQQQIDKFTSEYVLSGNLKNIFYESSENLKSVDRIIQYIKSIHSTKFALICFDCMGISEWELLKEYLQSLNFTFRERQSFALIPSITSISRSAIFYGSHTAVFSLASINEEKALQSHFPSKNCKLFREKDDISTDTLLGIDIAAIIYNFFDDLSHAAEFPAGYKNKSLYFDAVRSYLSASKILVQIHTLLSEGYQLFFCSDHGSVIATGNGKKIEKYLQEDFAKRACIIRETTLKEFLDFPQMRIPFIDDKFLVLARDRTMFDKQDKIRITHGGISVEEIVVPFIEVIK